jgi:phosphatidylethanolamine/phosphatidyl-N-methylethanolamine N-methyltransferase
VHHTPAGGRRVSSFAAFFQAIKRNPARAGAVAPSSSALSKRMAELVRLDGSHVLEIGAGTGAFTRALLDRGVAGDRLWAVEIDPELAGYLRRQFPEVQVVRGDAGELARLLPEEVRGQVGTVVSGVPMRNLKREERRRTVGSALEVLRPGGEFLQFTYGLRSPIETKGLGLEAEMVGRVWRNLPPAGVWRYRKV